jgi:3-dehydroquinate dehydratase-2
MNDETNPCRILVIHGPNLNMLGKRETGIYGTAALADIDRMLAETGKKKGVEIETFQSNSEGKIVDCIQSALNRCNGIIINPGAYTHTSIAIRDALLILDIPVIEVHLSNVYKRETFRHHSTISDIVRAKLTGFGFHGYILALEGLLHMIREG